VNTLNEQLWPSIEKCLDITPNEKRDQTIHEIFDNYIERRILGAHHHMILEGQKLISKKETIMVVGANIAFEQFFKIVSEKEGHDITVIVVDTCP